MQQESQAQNNSTSNNLRDPKVPVNKELTFRKNFDRILISSLTSFTVFLLLYSMPLYPLAIIIIISAISGFISFRSHLAGFIFGVGLSVPGYIYQSGAPLWWTFIFLFLLGAFSVRTLADDRYIIPSLIGLLSASIHFTPLFFLSIPIMLIVVLLDDHDRLINNLCILLLFLMVFLPFQSISFTQNVETTLNVGFDSMSTQEIYETMSQYSVPFFSHISYVPKPALSSLDINEISDTLVTNFQGNTLFHSYLFLILDKLALVFFPIMIGISFSTVKVVDRLWPWLLDRGANISSIIKYSNVLTMIITSSLFLIVVQVLGGSFGYYTSVNPIAIDTANEFQGSTIPLLLVFSSGSIGLIVTGTSLRMSRRMELAHLRSQLIHNSQKLSTDIKNLSGLITKIDNSCKGIDLSKEKTSVHGFGEDIRISLGNVDTMDYSSLKDVNTTIESLKKSELDTQTSIFQRVNEFNNERSYNLNLLISKLKSLGIESTIEFGISDSIEMSEFSLEETLQKQEQLNASYLSLAANTSQIAENLINSIKKDFDQNVQLTSVNIAKTLIEQKEGEKSIESLCNTLESLNTRYYKILIKTIERLIKLMERSRKMYESHLLPLNEQLGRDPFETKTGEITTKLLTYSEELSSQNRIIFLPEIMNRIEFLEKGTKSVLSELLNLIKEFENLNDSRVPDSFDWGKDTQLVGTLDNSIRFINTQDSNELGNRLSNIDYAIKAIEGATSTLKKYVIMNEFITNYSNIESWIDQTLERTGSLTAKELPIRAKYATQYIKLYSKKSNKNFKIDGKFSKIQIDDNKSS